MDATLLTPTLEACNALKDAGFPQDTVFTWTRQPNRSRQPGVVPREAGGASPAEESAAPTLTELLARLPSELAFSVPHPIFGSTERRHTLTVSLGSPTVLAYYLVGAHEVQHRVEHESAVEAAAGLYLALRADGRLGGAAEAIREMGISEETEPLARAA